MENSPTISIILGGSELRYTPIRTLPQDAAEHQQCIAKSGVCGNILAARCRSVPLQNGARDMGRDMGRDFKALHAAMKAAVKAQDAAGWANPEIERITARVLLGMWCCANNDPVPEVILAGLREDMAALEAARASIGRQGA